MATTSTPVLDRWLPLLMGKPPIDLATRRSDFPEVAALIDVLPGRLTAHVEDGSTISVEGGYLNASIDVTWKQDDGSRYGGADFWLSGVDGCCFWGSLDLEPEHQRARFGSWYVAMLAALCADVGIGKIKIDAEAIGRYAWARQGFTFAPAPYWRERTVQAAIDFAKRLNIDDVGIDLTTVKTPGQIADLAGILVTHEEFARARGEAPPAHPEPPMTIGKALLLGPGDSHWHGQLDVYEYLDRLVESLECADGPGSEAHHSSAVESEVDVHRGGLQG